MSSSRIGFIQRNLFFLLFLLLVAQSKVAISQTVDFDVSSTPVDLDKAYPVATLGEVRLVRSTTISGSQTTQAGTIRFVYSGVTITNLPAGPLSINVATGELASPGGILITVSGGFKSTGVSAQVSNVVTPTGPQGMVTLSIPANLAILSGDTIRINGLQVDTVPLVLDADILCSLQANPSNAFSFRNVSIVRAGHVVDHRPRITTPSPLPGGLGGQSYTLTLTTIEGVPAYNWLLIDGELPPGLHLGKMTGVISGVPFVGGTYAFTIKVIDSAGLSSTKDFKIDIQNFVLSSAGLDFGLVVVGQTATRPVTVTNQGGSALQIEIRFEGDNSFTSSPGSFTLDANKSQVVNIIYSPQSMNGGLPNTGSVLFSIPGLIRAVNLYGKPTQGSVTQLTSILPTSGSTQGNTKVTLRGTNFNAQTTASVGGVPLSNLKLTGSDELTGVTGSHAAGSVDVVITTPGSAGATLAGGFAYRELPPVTASANALRIPYAVDTDELRSNLGINNLSQESAEVEILMVDNNGLLLSQKTVEVPAGGLKQINGIIPFMEDSLTTTGREAALILQSDQSISAWISVIDQTTLDPGFLVAASSGGNQQLIPSSVGNARYSTSLIVMNSSNAAGTVNLVVRNAGGSLQFSLSNVSIPGNGFIYIDNVYQVAGGTSGYGPIEIEALNSGSVISAVRVYSTEHTGDFLRGVDKSTAQTQLLLPYAVDSSALRTNMGINNPGAVLATVFISLIDKDGKTVGTVQTTVPAHGLTQINDIVRVMMGQTDVTNEEGWLSLSSDLPICAWTSIIDNDTQDPNFAIGRSSGSDHWLIPSSVSTERFQSALVVVNVGTAPAAVAVKAINPDGSASNSSSLNIPANGLLSFQDIRASLGLAGSFGPIEIRSAGQAPLLTTSRVYSNQHTGGAFEGVVLDEP
ncbi:MAG: putative Ig domain-containing protein [Terriglobia bacterium]